MDNNLVFRIVKQDDYIDLQKYIYVRNTPDEIKKRVEDAIKLYETNEGMQLVCEADGHVIATVLIKKLSNLFKKHMAELYDVVTNEKYQGRGISKKLIEESKIYAKKSGIKVLLTSVRGGTPAETVYRKLGFIEYGRLKDGLIEPWSDGKTFDEVLFQMRLDE